MIIHETLDLIYRKCATRVKNAITNSGLPLDKIYSADPKILSAIQNNRITKRNPYLIPDRVFRDATQNDGLLKKLKLEFRTEQDVLWGKKEEIDSFAVDLFFSIISDLQWAQLKKSGLGVILLRKEFPKGIPLGKESLKRMQLERDELNKELQSFDLSIHDILIDYVPYAKYSTYGKLLFNGNNPFPALFYGVSEDSIIKNIEPSWNDAVHLLYKKCETDYLSELISFTQQTTSFHGINKVLYNNFICAKLVPILKKHIPGETSLGVRVKDLITADLSHTPKLITHMEQDGLKAYYKALNRASSEYILALEKIQAKLYRKCGI